ncbi:Abi family protein [Bifidobacterium catenulatum subsp. kashiwanohense]|nr:Abi family protein [Bifidobacterium catenulatum]MDH7882911.1 Abi family protein [Bifidobacterium catenulatum subsp. kashiwanohense]
MSLRKPYRSVNEQLRILRSRGMAVDAGAGHVLRREGYYPIVNGYKDLFLDRKACLTAGDDRYGTGARFDDLYALFLFDRELRELLFSSITRAEAALKAVCAHEFTGLHPDEVNPYLNPDYYDSRCRPSAMALIDKVFKRILELDGNPRNRGDYGGKAYIRHCMEDHNGQVPLWVLANDLSFGQTVWFFQV